jgi:isoleucyl-tRNA synthetase
MSWHSLCYILHGNISVYFDGTGNREHFDALKVYLLSRSISRLKNEFQAGNGKVNLQLLLNFFQNTCSSCLKLPLFLQITVDFIEGFPPIDLQLGKHVFLSTGDFYLATRS